MVPSGNKSFLILMIGGLAAILFVWSVGIPSYSFALVNKINTSNGYSTLAKPTPPPDPTERTATLIVINVVVNNFGTPVISSADWTMHLNGNNPALIDFPGSTTGVTVPIAPGPYAVTEDFSTHPSLGRSDYGIYTQSYSLDCVGNIAAGDTKTCTVTNTRQ